MLICKKFSHGNFLARKSSLPNNLLEQRRPETFLELEVQFLDVQFPPQIWVPGNNISAF
jgi:hypothetical protein